MSINTEYFKEKLEAEKAQLESELAQVARRNPDRQGDWEAIPEAADTASFEENMEADSIDDYEKNNAIVNTLEPRLNDVQEALKRIENNTYGLCEVCGKEIEEDRLEANPAAKTCQEHMN